MNYEINDENREHLVEWLNDRRQFGVWSVSVISGSFVVLSVFGSKPGFSDPPAVMLSLALICLLFSLVCHFVTVFSIPSWKLRLQTGQLSDSRRMMWEIKINTWLAVIAFVAGLTLAFIANIPV